MGRSAFLLWTLTCLILIAVLALSPLAVQYIADGNRIVSVLSFNIMHGETLSGDYDLDLIAQVITEADPDLVALQEVDFKTNRARKLDIVAELAEKTGMTPLFTSAIPYDDGEYGLGILSRWRFLQTRKLSLPYSSGYEQRAAAEIIVAIPSGDTIGFVNTHLEHRSREDRIAQAMTINAEFAHSRYPTILAGDLNAEPGSETIRILEEKWTSSYDRDYPAPTYPTGAVRVKIDYVMCLPQHRWEILESRVIEDTVASDHCAYFVRLRLLSD